MPGKNTCPKFGSALGRNAPAGVCPQCLMELGLPSDAGGKAGRDGAATSTTPPGGFIPPEPEELSEQFPQLEIVALLGQGGHEVDFHRGIASGVFAEQPQNPVDLAADGDGGHQDALDPLLAGGVGIVDARVVGGVLDGDGFAPESFENGLLRVDGPRFK